MILCNIEKILRKQTERYKKGVLEQNMEEPL